MNNHYIPRLLLKQFAVSDKVNTYDFKKSDFSVKKIKKTFCEQDIFDPELEAAFAQKLEGPFGNLLNHKLLFQDIISVDRRENLLMRKFLLINFLRAPLINGTWDEIIKRAEIQDHPSVQVRDFLIRHDPELKEIFAKGIPSKKTYIPDLKKAMEIDSLEEIVKNDRENISLSLRASAESAMITTITFWDCEDTGQEFILPKVPGAEQMDALSIFHKTLVIRKLKTEAKQHGISIDLMRELERLEYGSCTSGGNFSAYPISPTRILICFSPYFRGFFPIMDPLGNVEIYPPLLQTEQFNRHFYKPMRMELFRPCRNICNQFYQYPVKKLRAEEVMELNALLLDVETEEFVFHDYNKIRDSFWYYDKKAKFEYGKKHDFSCLG